MTRRDGSQLPPTPPPLPSFLRKNVNEYQDKSDSFEKNFSQIHRRVKLILPNEPPGETSTDDTYIVPDVPNKYHVAVDSPKSFINNNHNDIKSQGKRHPPPVPRRKKGRSKNKFIFLGKVINIMTCLTSLLVLVVVLTLYFISNAKTEKTFVDPQDVKLDHETLTDTLIQVLDPWIDDSGEKIQRYSLTNTAGTQLIVMSYGATVTNLILGGDNGDDVVLGYDNIEQYKSKDNPYFGATVGRVANRIKEGHFNLNGVTYNLTINNGNNTLHGGVTGWDKKNWKSSVLGDKVVFNYVSQDGEEGFPGTVLATVTYSLSEDNTVLVRMTAKSDEPTPINMANHAYYNLAGHKGGSHDGLYNHVVTIRAPHYTPVNAELIPTGDITPVLGTMFDLTKGVRLGNVINSIPGPTPDNNGYDHNFAITRNFEDKMRLISIVEYPKKLRKMKIFSNQPGVQFYTGNFLPRSGMAGKNGANYTFHGGFCLETQNFPDFVNNPSFPNGILLPGQTYVHNLAIQIN